MRKADKCQAVGSIHFRAERREPRGGGEGECRKIGGGIPEKLFCLALCLNGQEHGTIKLIAAAICDAEVLIEVPDGGLAGQGGERAICIGDRLGEDGACGKKGRCGRFGAGRGEHGPW